MVPAPLPPPGGAPIAPGVQPKKLFPEGVSASVSGGRSGGGRRPALPQVDMDANEVLKVSWSSYIQN